MLPALEARFTVLAIDRRGRGQSGDADDYAIEREYEDVAAVVESAGDEVNVLGHSYGGICALESALLTDAISKLRYRHDLSDRSVAGRLEPQIPLVVPEHVSLVARRFDGLSLVLVLALDRVVVPGQAPAATT